MSDVMICVGSIAGSYGVKGNVRVKSFCADPQSLQDYDPLTTEDGKTRFSIDLIGQVKNGFSASIKGILNKEEADALKGTRLYVSRDQLPSLPDDEYYYSDLIGLDVYDTGGELMGKVVVVDNHGAGDLLEVLPNGSGNSFIVPFTLEVVPLVDMAARRIVVDLPEGLLS